MNPEVQQLVESLQLLPHPEGGFYRETYRSPGSIPQAALPEDFAGDRSHSTAIYFLLTEDNCSHLHRIASDEVWHFYSGHGLQVHVIHPEDGRYEVIRLGHNLTEGEVFQAVVPAGAWFGATVEAGYALVGCTVAPGFDFAEFEMADKDNLLKIYPDHAAIIEQLAP